MAVRRPIVNINGQLEELPSGDTVAGAGGSASIQTVEIDFGSVGVVEKVFELAITCAANQPIVASMSLNMPSSVQFDELEMDPIDISAHCIATNTVRIIASSISRTPVTGKRNVNFILG